MNLSLKHYYWRWLKNLALLFVLVLFVMTLARVGFMAYFGNGELTSQPSAVRSAFFLGMRYDLMPLAYINLIPFLLLQLGYFLPGKTAIKIIRSSIISILTFGLMALFWFYVFDYAFYSYFQDHINILFFGFFEDDTVALLTSIWKNYNLPFWLVIFALVHWGIFRLVKFLFSPFNFDLKPRTFDWRVVASGFCGLAFLGFLGRGNFSRLPLSIEDAHISTNEFINELSLNGVLTFNRAMKIRKEFNQKEYNYLKKYGFNTWQEAYQTLFHKDPSSHDFKAGLLAKSPKNPEAAKEPPHVVLIVMESFGSYWNDQHSPKFNILGELEHHFKEGIHFKNFLSAENGTIGSIVSVATSEVIRPGARFLSESDFMHTPLDIAGHLPYRNAGYETHFIYGGKLGWRDLGKYLSVQKYDNLWGADEIKEAMPELNNIDQKDLGNEWGIFDEYLYAFIEEQLRTATKPQFFLVMTTSNHPPFEFPSSYNTLPLELNSEVMAKVTVSEEIARKRFLGLQYANQKTGEFISKIRSTALHDKTIVALTGDHSYWIAKGVGTDQEFKRFAVPFLISAPDRLRPGNFDPNNFGSHEDIFPSLYHLSLSEQPYIKLGEDLFSERGLAINSSGLVANEYGAFHGRQFWIWKDREHQILETSPQTPELAQIKRMKEAAIGLTDLYLKTEKSNKSSDAKNDQQ